MSRDYEAGYRDGSMHYELEHCPACKNVAGLQKALADNDKLWDLNEHMRLKDMSIIGELEEENDKLRKLAHKMWKPFCWAQSGYDVCLPDEEDREIRDLAHELGVEVPE